MEQGVVQIEDQNQLFVSNKIFLFLEHQLLTKLVSQVLLLRAKEQPKLPIVVLHIFRFQMRVAH